MKEKKIFYYYPKKNFGDQLNILLCEKILNYKPILRQPYKADLVMIGSVLEPFILSKHNFKNTIKKIIFPKIQIFGSGFIMEPKAPNESYIRKLDLLAVRGKLTRERFAENLKKNLDFLTLGDPGLLSSMLIDTNKIQKKYSVGLIPHYINNNNPKIIKFHQKIPNSKIINMIGDPLTILKEISECEVIFSNAMHGLIAADSLGIPNKRLLMQNKLTGGEYKFEDYYSIFNSKSNQPIDFNSITIDDFLTLSDSLRKSSIEKEREEVLKIQEQLLNIAKNI